MMNAEGMTQSYGRLWRFNNMYDAGCGLSMGKIMRVMRGSWHGDLRKETDNKKQIAIFVMMWKKAVYGHNKCHCLQYVVLVSKAGIE